MRMIRSGPNLRVLVAFASSFSDSMGKWPLFSGSIGRKPSLNLSIRPTGRAGMSFDHGLQATGNRGPAGALPIMGEGLPSGDLLQSQANELRIVVQVTVSEASRLAHQTEQPFQPERCIHTGARGFVPAWKSN